MQRSSMMVMDECQYCGEKFYVGSLNTHEKVCVNIPDSEHLGKEWLGDEDFTLRSMAIKYNTGSSFIKRRLIAFGITEEMMKARNKRKLSKLAERTNKLRQEKSEKRNKNDRTIIEQIRMDNPNECICGIVLPKDEYWCRFCIEEGRHTFNPWSRPSLNIHYEIEHGITFNQVIDNGSNIAFGYDLYSNEYFMAIRSPSGSDIISNETLNITKTSFNDFVETLSQNGVHLEDERSRRLSDVEEDVKEYRKSLSELFHGA